MALTNAQKQARWRDKRNEEAQALKGKPEEIANNILSQLGVKEAKRLALALDKRLRNIKPDCPECHGTGYSGAAMPCGTPLPGVRVPCDCQPPKPMPEGWIVVRHNPGRGRALVFWDVWPTQAEAENQAEELRAYHNSLKRKPKDAGPFEVITTAELDRRTGGTCYVS